MVGKATHALMATLSLNDDTNNDNAYHRQVRLLSRFVPSDSDASPLIRLELDGIIRALPNTASGIKWTNNSACIKGDTGRNYGGICVVCISEVMFPDVWKDGRILILSKVNGK
ncbi:hypothetical protein EVAR_91238_1 [Eumeta japonica]|uniref:Uncharacterized protein n=1 Tax=Eumeta variegata TaxID=151549 RepID=A0A4C1ZZ55_EUMVA|nr:hypothetical protein EVAR_91238_1 [Eumeta japonica]